jgi:hypothetical protein
MGTRAEVANSGAAQHRLAAGGRCDPEPPRLKPHVGPTGTIVKPIKPFRLRRWKAGAAFGSVCFFTCARPGRTGSVASKSASVPDDVAHRWVLGLPGPRPAIVSLLGSKPGGPSEFSFYTFYGGFDSPASNVGKLSFQDWLNRCHPDPSIPLREHPTWDYQRVPDDICQAVVLDIKDLAEAGRTVTLVDSGGQQRSGQLCSFMSAVEDFAHG